MTLYLFFSLDSVDFNGEWITGMKVYEYRVQLILYGFFSKLQQFMYTIIFNGVWRKMYTFFSILSTIIQVVNIQTSSLDACKRGSVFGSDTFEKQFLSYLNR